MGVIDIIDRKRKEAITFPHQVTVWIVTGLLFSTICLYMFIRLSTELIEKKTFLFDQKVIDIVQSFSSPVMDGVMLFITDMGSKFMLGLLLGISMIWLLMCISILEILYLFKESRHKLSKRINKRMKIS